MPDKAIVGNASVVFFVIAGKSITMDFLAYGITDPHKVAVPPLNFYLGEGINYYSLLYLRLLGRSFETTENIGD